MSSSQGLWPRFVAQLAILATLVLPMARHTLLYKPECVFNVVVRFHGLARGEIMQ